MASDAAPVEEETKHAYFMKQALLMVKDILKATFYYVYNLQLLGRKSPRDRWNASRVCLGVWWESSRVRNEWHKQVYECKHLESGLLITKRHEQKECGIGPINACSFYYGFTSIHTSCSPLDWRSPGNKTCRISCHPRDASKLPQILLAFYRSLCDSWTMRHVCFSLDAIPNPSCIFWMWQWTLWRHRKCAFIAHWVGFPFPVTVSIY